MNNAQHVEGAEIKEQSVEQRESAHRASTTHRQFVPVLLAARTDTNAQTKRVSLAIVSTAWFGYLGSIWHCMSKFPFPYSTVQNTRGLHLEHRQHCLCVQKPSWLR